MESDANDKPPRKPDRRWQEVPESEVEAAKDAERKIKDDGVLGGHPPRISTKRKRKGK